MANVHVLELTGNDVRIVCHVPVPVWTNNVGMALQDALASHLGVGVSVLPEGTGQGGTVATDELAQIRDRSVLEVVVTRTLEDDWASLSDEEQFKTIDLGYAALVKEVQETLMRRYSYYGFSK